MEDTKEFYVHEDHVVEFFGIVEEYALKIGNTCTNGDDTLMITLWYDTSSSVEVQVIKKLEKLTEND